MRPRQLRFSKIVPKNKPWLEKQGSASPAQQSIPSSTPPRAGVGTKPPPIPKKIPEKETSISNTFTFSYKEREREREREKEMFYLL